MLLSGYSGTPLARKLGIKESSRVRLINEPDYYLELFTDMPDNVEFLKDNTSKKDLIHFFTRESSELHQNIISLRKEIFPNGILWISWPKMASKVPTDIKEDLIRNLALRNGLVDVKVCSVDEIWSGLKLVIPLIDRKMLK
ncbi:MAG: DUF3052 domain-containing protein [Bacteroidota bacterium]